MPIKVKDNRDKQLHLESSSQRILLEEYRFLHTQYLNRRNETLTRTNFFITAASVSLGGVLVFSSANNNLSLTTLKFILITVLILLFIIGLEIQAYLVHRDIASDRDLRALARIRRYFVELDPKLNDYFLSVTTDIPTGYLVKNTSGMRHIMQIIEGFLFGFALMILSTFISPVPVIIVTTGIVATIITFIVLEAIARRRFRLALRKAKEEIRFEQ